MAAKKGATAKDKSAAQSSPAPWTHGHFYWNELRTRDVERAKKFYADSVGWRFERSHTPDGNDYWLAFEGEACVAGFFSLKGTKFESMPESWMSFLAVDDVDTRVAKAVRAGAKLVLPIFDVPEVGRIAMLQEPSGAGVGWMTPVGTMRKGQVR